MSGSIKKRRPNLAPLHSFRACAIALVTITMCGTGLSGDCPGSSGGPCVDGTFGDRLSDFNDGNAVSVRLTNRSTDYVHLIGTREAADLCNRVDDNGGSRFILVPSQFISYRVEAWSNGKLIDTIVCELTGDVAEVVYSDFLGLQCVNFGG